MRLAPGVLEHRLLRLEPLGDIHREALRAACDADPHVWRDLYPWAMSGEHFDPRWRWLMEQNGKGEMISFAVAPEGGCCGMTSFLAIDRANATVEIGATYYAPQARGGLVNPAAKRLLLGCAFESGARRVQLKVDALNLRSRAAVLKLGAVQEGTLRQDRVTWTGRIRDTVVFSILRDEWPAVRDRLDARLEALA